MSRFHDRRKTRQAADRARAATMLPSLCPYCAEPVTATDPWDVDHDPPLSQGGGSVVRPAHRSCNRSAGARLANSLRGVRRWAR